MNDFVILLFGFILGPGLALLATPIFVFLQKMFYIPLVRQKMIQKARKNGTYVTAYLVKSSNVYDGGHLTPYTHGYYKYEWRGKTYKYWCKTANNLPEQITLYFKKKPRKALTAAEFGLNESNWFLSFLIMSIAMCIFVWVAGFSGVGMEWLQKIE